MSTGSAEVGDSDGWACARWRLRDLRGRDLWLIVSMAALLLIPFVVSLAHAFGDGWVPSGDIANIATRAHDVFTSHPPLTGLPSTSSLYGDKISTNHPGPIEFYLLAVPLRALGMTAGTLFSAAAINAAFVLIVLWVFFRRLGSTAALWAGVLLLAVMWSAGTNVLTDAVSSNMTMYSLLCTAVLAWALIDGDLPLLPLGAFVASYAAQQHLAAGLVVLTLTVAVAVALAYQVVTRLRRGDAGVKRYVVRYSAMAAAVAGVCWLPVLIDEVTGHPGNLTAIVKFARDNSRPTLGAKSGLYQAVHAVALPSVLGHTNTTGLFFLDAPGAGRIATFLLIVVALGALAWRARVTAAPVARLALVALVVLAAGIFNGTNVPLGTESARINLYRWTWAAAFTTCAALGLGLAILWRHATRGAMEPRTRYLAPIALVVVGAVIASATAFASGSDDRVPDRVEFAAEKRVAAAVLARVGRGQPVLVVEVGADAQLAIGPALIFRLVQAGRAVQVSSTWTTSYGNNRRFRPRTRPVVLLVKSGKAALPSGPGALLAREPINPEHSAEFDALAAKRTALLEKLAAGARGTKLELAPGAAALIARRYSVIEQYALNVEFAQLPTDPIPALSNPEFLSLVLSGQIRSPQFDTNTVRELLALPASDRGIWGDEQVEVRLLTPDQFQHSQFAVLR